MVRSISKAFREKVELISGDNVIVYMFDDSLKSDSADSGSLVSQ